MRNLLFLAVVFGPLVSSVAMAQHLQLPELHQFTTGGSYLIPDRGSVYGGGVMRAAESNSPSGIPYAPSGRNVTVSPRTLLSTSGTRTRVMQGSNITAKATIHGDPYRTKPYGHELGEQSNTDVDSLRMIGAADLNQKAPSSLAAIRQQLTAEDAAANQEAIRYADMAEDCLKQGKTSIAKLFYRSAINTARGKYQEHLKLRLAEIDKSASVGR